VKQNNANEYWFEPISADNAQASFNLHSKVQYKPWSKAVFVDCLSVPYFANQLIFSEHLQGYYIGLQVLDEVTLMDIAVAPQFQGQGIGKQVLQDFISQCRLRNALDIWLEVRESNTVAQQLYMSFGFELIEKRKAYYQTETGTESAMIMNLSLAEKKE
jgi:[ribosomal protein S18]-alanine N-acetyltransferase